MTKDRIDVHQHVVPPFWAKALSDNGGDPSGWASPSWTPDGAIDFMDRLEIEVGILSLTAPSVVGWPDIKRREMARKVNDYTADLVAKRPHRFGNFLTLPLPDVDGALAEVEYGFGTLKCDGVILLSNYQDAYLGASGLEPLWKELNQRSAIVFIHPGKPNISVLGGIPGPIIDYPFDTTRAAVHLVLNGVTARYPRLKIILSHAGGFLPYASHRFAELTSALEPEKFTVDGILAEFRRFYFDTALSSGPAALPTLQSFADPEHILYGSDFPYAPASVGESFTAKLDAYSGFDENDRLAINRNNALKLFDRLDSHLSAQRARHISIS